MAKPLSKIVFLEDPQNPSGIYILDTESLIVGQVWMFKTEEEMKDFLAKRPEPKCKILEYRIVVVYNSLLFDIGRRYVYQYQIELLASAYYKYRITPNAPRYARYKES